MTSALLNEYYSENDLPLHPYLDSLDADSLADLQEANYELYYRDFCREICWDEGDGIMKQCFTASLDETHSYLLSFNETLTPMRDYYCISSLDSGEIFVNEQDTRRAIRALVNK